MVGKQLGDGFVQIQAAIAIGLVVLVLAEDAASRLANIPVQLDDCDLRRIGLLQRIQAIDHLNPASLAGFKRLLKQAIIVGGDHRIREQLGDAPDHIGDRRVAGELIANFVDEHLAARTASISSSTVS